MNDLDQQKQIVEREGRMYLVPPLVYRTFSEQEKPITVFLH